MEVADRRRMIGSLSLAYVLLACGLSVTAALPELRRTVRMTDTVTSLHGSFFGWGLLVGGLFGSRALVRFGRMNVLVLGVVAVGIGGVLFGTARVVGQSLAGGASIGLGGAAVVSAIPGLVADRFGSERNAIFTRLNVAPGLGGFSFPLLLAAAPVVGISWRWPTSLLPGILVLVFLVSVVPLLRRTSADGESAGTSVRAVLALLRLPGVRQRFFLQTLHVGIEFSLGTWIVIFLREEGGFSKAAAPIGAAAWAIGMMSSRSLVPKLIARLGTRLEPACLVGGILSALTVLLVPVAPLRLLVVVFAAFSFGPLYTLGVERLFVNAEAAGCTDTTAVSSLAAVASGLAITIGPFVVGVVADLIGLRAGLLFGPAAAAVALVLCAVRWGGEAGLLGQTRPALTA
jgi:predicted MFS family arabinose efflux permease